MKKVAQILLSFSLLLICFGCTSTKNNSVQNNKLSLESQIKSYETRARSYKALADAQILSPAYSSPEFRNYSRLSGHNLRMVYLQEVNRYKQLADEARKELQAKKKLER